MTRTAELKALVLSCFDECSDFYPIRGEAESKRLLIAPPLTNEDVLRGMPFSGSQSSKVFEQILDEKLGLSTNKDFVVVSCTDTAGKVIKSNTREFMSFLEKVIEKKLFDLYLCVGSDAFKTAFGRGRKPSMESLAGNVMIMPEAKNKRVAVFPDVEPLIITNPGDHTCVRKSEYQQGLVARTVKKLKGKI